MVKPQVRGFRLPLEHLRFLMARTKTSKNSASDATSPRSTKRSSRRSNKRPRGLFLVYFCTVFSWVLSLGAVIYLRVVGDSDMIGSALVTMPGIVFLGLPTLGLAMSLWLGRGGLACTNAICVGATLWGWAGLQGMPLLYSTVALVGLCFLSLAGLKSGWSLVAMTAGAGLVGATMMKPPVEPALGPAQIRVLQYNVRFCDLGVAEVAKVVKNSNADVLTLQEVDLPHCAGTIPKKLSEALPEYEFVVDGQMLIATRLPIEKIDRRTLPSLPKFRKAIGVVVSKGGKKWRLWSVHLESYPLDNVISDPKGTVSEILDAVEDRKAQGAAVLEIAREQDIPSVICGDFNQEPRGTLYTTLTKQMTDSFANKGDGFGYTFPARAPIVRIDYIWCPKRVTVKACSVVGVAASDHRPVVAVLEQ